MENQLSFISIFFCIFINPNHFFQFEFCPNLLDMRNLQEQVKKAFCYQKLSWHFTVWINCFSDLKKCANSQPSASNFKSVSRSLQKYFLIVGHNNFGNKIPLCIWKKNSSLTLIFLCNIITKNCRYKLSFN